MMKKEEKKWGMKLPAASHGVSQQRMQAIQTLQAAGYLP